MYLKYMLSTKLKVKLLRTESETFFDVNVVSFTCLAYAFYTLIKMLYLLLIFDRLCWLFYACDGF